MKISFLSIVLSLSLNCFAQSPKPADVRPPGSPNPSAPQVERLDPWRRATIALGVVVQDGKDSKFVTTGSGVIVSVDAHYGCLLTAKHMVLDPNTGKATPRLWMRFPSPDGRAEEPIPLDLFDQQGRNLWRTSEDGGDLAVIPLPVQALVRLGTPVPSVPLSDFADPKDDVFQGAPVLVLGYPQIVGEQYLSSPIARGGIVAWVNPKDPADEPFLVDANLYNGNSGGPVFRVRNGFDKYGNFMIGGGLVLLGIVSKGPLQTAPIVSADGYVYHQNPATGAENPEVAVVANVGGIGIIEPASRARKLIKSVFPGVAQPSPSTLRR